MKRFYTLAIAGMLGATSHAALADSGSLNDFKPRVLPVLVQVDSQGKVTDASPAIELSPSLKRLLRQNLDEMVAGPAMEHQRPISSQFVVNLALDVAPRDEGDYYAKFSYVSASPVPSGSWYWVHINGHRLALANRQGQTGPRRYTDWHSDSPRYQAPPRTGHPWNAVAPRSGGATGTVAGGGSKR